MGLSLHKLDALRAAINKMLGFLPYLGRYGVVTTR